MLPSGLAWVGGYLVVTVVLAVLAYVYWDSRTADGSAYLLAAALCGGIASLSYVLCWSRRR